MTFPHTVSRLSISAYFLVALASSACAVTGCAATTDASNANDESAASSSSDLELAHIGGAGAFALGSDGVYFVFDNALYRVDKTATQVKLAEAPDHAGQMAVTDRYVVLAASPLSSNTLTFYDRTQNFAETTLVVDSSVLEMLPATQDRVVVSSFEAGVYVVGADGKKKVLYTPTKNAAVRDLKPGATPDVVYGVVDTFGKDPELLEINVKTARSRVVLHVPEGAFTYVYDADTDTFFTERAHVSLPDQSELAIYDHNGHVLTSVDTPLNTLGAVAVDKDAFYLAARPGVSPGSGSWKIFAYDKTTLASQDRGRVEPQVFSMTVRGKDLYYTHMKSSSVRLRVRPL